MHLTVLKKTGKLTSLREFIKITCEKVGFDIYFDGQGLDEKVIDKKTGNILCKVSENYFRISDTKGKIGSTKKLKFETNWEPKISIEDMIEKMVEKDLERRLNGK